ncbi:unnamed protein product [Callosobruchus maculatus]|uniref:Ion transport domain-containing protein n=2 Tax=Callosobruchus maculatus TaxID=64391 RepID=A0A653CQH8_CALMS|nr:unnamed protein product [Callosobruchus maculatus]
MEKQRPISGGYRPLSSENGGTALQRTNSICPSPDTQLLEAVLQNNVAQVYRLVRNNLDLLNHVYTPEYNKPILLIACSEENVNADTVQALVDSGANLSTTSELDQGWSALHFAAAKTDTSTLQVIIRALKHPGDINMLAKGNNALHVLIKHGDSTKNEEFKRCAQLLVEAGINVNQTDNNGFSSVLLAAKKGYRDVIEVILEKSPFQVDLDSHQLRNKKTARDLILSEKLYDGVLPGELPNNNFQTGETQVLFECIKRGLENGFINYNNGEIENVDADDTSNTLLQLCCEKGLAKATRHLLDKGADPNKVTSKNIKTPIEIAAERGYYEIFKLLCDHPKTEKPFSFLLSTFLKCYENEKFPDLIDYKQCYIYLMDHLRFNPEKIPSLINEQDDSKNSPLHYAVRYSDQERVEELLDLGASLGSKNKSGVMPVHDIEPKMLERHLDRCIEFDKSGKKYKEDFSVTFNYRTLIPPRSNKVPKVEKDLEENLNQSVVQELVAETEVIAYMSQATEFKHLLAHPVIVTFLFMKWHKIRWIFNINLAFYFAFFLSLVFYVFLSYANFRQSDKTSLELLILIISVPVLMVTFFILILRELFQMAVSPGKYFKSFENYIELVLIFITGAIIFTKTPDEHTRKPLAAISILLAAFELVLMLGQHPKFSTNVVMLRTVSYNFFKFLVWYSLLIVAFALSFYIIFSKTEVASPPEQEEEDFFTDPGKSLFKTIVMLTGEFDASNMNFHTFPFTSIVIFSLFIFMIAIILVNLLNGLAVSDTQIIKSNAELVGHIARAQHIYYVETMLLGNILPKKMLTKFENLFCCYPSKRWNLIVLKPLAEKACLFPRCNKCELTVYPNKGGEIAVSNNSCCFGYCNHIRLEKETVKEINSIVRMKREEMEDEKQECACLQKLEEVLMKISELDNKMEIIMQCLPE